MNHFVFHMFLAMFLTILRKSGHFHKHLTTRLSIGHSVVELAGQWTFGRGRRAQELWTLEWVATIWLSSPHISLLPVSIVVYCSLIIFVIIFCYCCIVYFLVAFPSKLVSKVYLSAS